MLCGLWSPAMLNLADLLSLTSFCPASLATVSAVVAGESFETLDWWALVGAGLAIGWLAGLTNTPLAPTLLAALLAAGAVANSIPGLPAVAPSAVPSARVVAVISIFVAGGFTCARIKKLPLRIA